MQVQGDKLSSIHNGWLEKLTSKVSEQWDVIECSSYAVPVFSSPLRICYAISIQTSGSQNVGDE
jgi:hypothetical protein